MDNAAEINKYLEQIKTQTTKQLGELAGMLTPQKTASVTIGGEKVTMNLVGKGESGIVMLVYRDKTTADKAFQNFINNGTNSHKTTFLRRIYQSLRGR